MIWMWIRYVDVYVDMYVDVDVTVDVAVYDMYMMCMLI